MTGICGWFLAFLFFLGAECICRCLVSLWFACGAVAAFVLAALGRQIEEQLLNVCPGFLGSISAYKAVGVSGKFFEKLKNRGFSCKNKKEGGRTWS